MRYAIIGNFFRVGLLTFFCLLMENLSAMLDVHKVDRKNDQKAQAYRQGAYTVIALDKGLIKNMPDTISILQKDEERLLLDQEKEYSQDEIKAIIMTYFAAAVAESEFNIPLECLYKDLDEAFKVFISRDIMSFDRKMATHLAFIVVKDRYAHNLQVTESQMKSEVYNLLKELYIQTLRDVHRSRIDIIIIAQRLLQKKSVTTEELAALLAKNRVSK